MDCPIKIVVSGLGLIGFQHALRIRQSSDATLVGVVQPKDCVNHDVDGIFCDVPLYNDLEDALDSLDVDGVIVSSPNAFHNSQSLICIRKGIPVLVEKPIADNLSSAEEILVESRASGVPVLVGHHRTYNPLVCEVRKLIRSSMFGRLVAMQGSALFYKPDHYFVEGSWRTRLGGGVLLINMIHEVGLMRHLCGEVVKVTALAGHDVRGFEVEDTVTIGLHFENGAMGSFLLSDAAASSKSWELTAGENPAYPQQLGDTCYHFSGTNGSVDFPTMNYRYYDSSVTPSWWEDFSYGAGERESSDPLQLQLDHFINVIRGLEEPMVSALDGYRNMAVVEAIKESIEKGRVIELPKLADS
ncbi:Gfo/Idh/MocA family protein [Rubritalea marina]|uniref:Gfo/Idh/MocA family protein n=1 Tax=Rubritalea marina TaxID=361055 RepID=UPI00036C12A5|nr:Gfo/Idh/MocA family oxidoreductase [Rubritalea marina]